MYIKNKKASFNYSIKEALESGIQLQGWEVKAIRSGMVDISDSFVYITKDMQVFVSNLKIQKWKFARINAPENVVSHRLLLHKKQAIYLSGKIKTDGSTLIPIAIYTKKGLIKLEIALAEGKKLHDKRQSIKERDIARQNRTDHDK